MYKILYIHIPKTGGTSIKHALEPIKDKLVITESSKILKQNSTFHTQHLKVMSFKMSNAMRFRKILGEEKWNSLWKVAFVRNPWDRYVSNWKWLTRKESLYPKKGWKARGWQGEDGNISFDNFVKQMSQCYIELNFLHNYQHDKWHLRNQIEHLCDQEGNIMIDHVARFENLQAEFKMICDKAGVQMTLPHLNHEGHYSAENKTHDPQEKNHYSKYYTSELVEIVAKRCAADIEAF